ncbi:Putative peptidoglycan binding domain-containing protein [Burkholderia orbicola]|nr:Putative peptidoglycan binding domain-containing protein [Burkholderia orbicola]
MKTRRLGDHGDHGDDVGLLQRRLIRAGYAVQITHVYDAATEAAVIALQRKTDLVDDGIAGPKTYAALATGQRDPKHLALADLERAARTLDVPLACIRAVNEVESRRAGFLSGGRPVILFERHVFWKRLQARGIDPAPFAARQPDIVSRTRGGYRGGGAEYLRLAMAESIDAGAAWESASWGAFQVMGYHWERLGYAGIDAFVACMEDGEAQHLDAFVRYIAADDALRRALGARQWAAFARAYNGPDYAANLYDVKLARAFDRYASLAAASMQAAAGPTDATTTSIA